MDRGWAKTRLWRMVALAVVLFGALYYAKRWPKDQTVHYMLGSAAPRVVELDARWAPGMAADEDWTREASFRYAAGEAPRVVTHEPRLPDGDYTVEIEIVAAPAPAASSGEAPAQPPPAKNNVIVRKHVTLSGGSTSIDLASVVP